MKIVDNKWSYFPKIVMEKVREGREMEIVDGTSVMKKREARRRDGRNFLLSARARESGRERDISSLSPRRRGCHEDPPNSGG